jgi:Type II secretion system (T2SS), protein E, N-terminal domain
MSALTSLLVRDRIVPVSKIEEALQTQVLSGGDIDTVLLEMDLVPEDVLSAYRAALFGLLPATRDEVMRAPREAITRVPQKTAKERNLVPLLLDGRALVVAAIEPLSDLDLRALRELLGYDVTARIVTRPRLSAGLAHHYGLELAPRTRRLVDALRRREPGIIPYVRPPTPSMMPRSYADTVGDGDESSAVHLIGAADSEEVALGEPTEPSPDDLPPLKVADAGQPELVDPGVSTEPAEAAEIPMFAMSEAPPELVAPEAELEASEPPMLEASEQPTLEASEPPPEQEQPEAALVAETQEAPSAPRALAENLAAGLEVGRATTLPPQNLTVAIANGTRGPISSERAIQLLAQAQQRDDVLFVLLRYAQQFFDFVGIFSVGKEGARGRMAHGVGLSQELMEHLIVPLEGGGLFARAVRDRRALVGDFAATDEERAAAALLGRSVNRPALVVPILLRGRAVLLIHADRDGIAVEDGACIQEIATPVKDALQRIILQNKTLRRGSVGPGASLPESDGTGLDASQPIPLDGTGPLPVAGSSSSEGEGGGGTVLASAEPVTADVATSPPSVRPPRASRSSGPGQLDLEAELTAVDLEAVSRLGLTRRNDGEPPVAGSDIAHEARAPRDGAWGKLPGIPRSAPPPPRRDSGAPGPGSVGSYRYVAATGLVAEKVRQRDPARSAPSSPSTSVPPEPARAGRNSQAPSEKGVAKPSSSNASKDEAAQRRESAANRPSNKRLSLVTPEPNQPSVIIDMGDQVSFLVEGLLQAPRNEEPPQVAELLKLGESALPVLIQHFPGPLWFDRATLRAGRVPRGRDVSGVARALCAFGEKAAPYLAGKLATGDDELSYFALLVAGEIVHPDLLDAVARRALGPDDVLRHVALDVLRRYTRLSQFTTILRALSDLSERPGKDPRRQHLAVVALGSLRDARTLQTLIARLSDGGEAIAEAAHKALVELTAQDFGLAPRRWEAWGEQYGSQHRIEWLIESLMHVEPEIRALASDELKRETQQYFGYHPGMPKRDRELSQRKYREWWQDEGKALFRS